MLFSEYRNLSHQALRNQFQIFSFDVDVIMKPSQNYALKKFVQLNCPLRIQNSNSSPPHYSLSRFDLCTC